MSTFFPSLHSWIPMSSAASARREKLKAELVSSGFEMAPCSRCRNAKPQKDGSRVKCVVGARSGRCSECVRKGYPNCDATLSVAEWEKCKVVREKLRKDLERADEEEVEMLHEQQRLLARLSSHKAKKIRLRKQLRLAEKRTDSAIQKELEELEAADAVDDTFLPAEEGIEVVESSGSAWEMSAFDWDHLGDPSFPLEGLESFGLPIGETSSEVPGSS